jgi:hypothetical protein
MCLGCQSSYALLMGTVFCPTGQRSLGAEVQPSQGRGRGFHVYYKSLAKSEETRGGLGPSSAIGSAPTPGP